MKKIISVFLILALCLSLASALAEDSSLPGVWYISTAESNGASLSIVDPEAITLDITDDSNFTMTAMGIGKAGTYTVKDSVLALTADDQTVEMQISGDELIYDAGNAILHLSKTPAESLALPVVFFAASAEDFDGTWVPFAQVSTGLYAEMSDEAKAAAGKMILENGKISIMADDGTGKQIQTASYETTFADGVLEGEDNSVLPTKMTLSLREDGSLFYDAVMSFGPDTNVEITYIYTRETAE